MSRPSVKRSAWRKIYEGIEHPKGGLLPEWVGGVFVGVLIVGFIVSLLIK